MTDKEIQDRLDSALNKLLKFDSHLIEFDVSERAITHKLAEHLQSEFPDFNVDCEYNRNLGDEKRLDLIQEELSDILRKKFNHRLEDLSPDEVLSISTYPDIIVHIRNCNKSNILIIEVKKACSRVPFDLDDAKLRAFTDKGDNNPYHYQLGVFIEIRTGIAPAKYPEVNWY